MRYIATVEVEEPTEQELNVMAQMTPEQFRAWERELDEVDDRLEKAAEA